MYGNFIAGTLSCNTQRLFTHNIIVKQIGILMIIFFTLSMSDKSNINPLLIIKKALYYGLYT